MNSNISALVEQWQSIGLLYARSSVCEFEPRRRHISFDYRKSFIDGKQITTTISAQENTAKFTTEINRERFSYRQPAESKYFYLREGLVKLTHLLAYELLHGSFAFSEIALATFVYYQ